MKPPIKKKWLPISIPGWLATGGSLACLLFSFLFTGCANIQSPMGGAKDTIAPVLIKAEPNENTTNFKGNTLRFTFDEYIKLENLNDNLIINPPAEKYPIILSKLHNVSVKILDTLKPNTTYTFNFGNAIRDVNESNPFKNFDYAFSTGPYIDSLEIVGRLEDAETGIADSTLLIILHKTEADSAVAKQKPSFATRANGKGVFKFDHLPSGNFYIFALKDEGVKRYTSNQIPFAFHDTIVVSGARDSIMLRSFIAEKEPEKKPKVSASKNEKDKEDKKLKHTVSVKGSTQDLLEPLTITFTHRITSIDTAKIQLTDTLYNAISGYKLSADSTGSILSISNAWKDNESYKLILAKGFATDSLGVTTVKADTINFKSKAESDYGSLKLKFSGIDMTRHPVLQFVESNIVSLSAPLTRSVYTEKLFRPGQYTLRILYDDNQNGIWDTGDYWKKLQPEYVLPILMPINVKANYENELEINL